MATSHSPTQNRLLAALPAAHYERLRVHLEPVPLALGEVLYEAGGKQEYVYFPTGSIVSLLYVMQDGSSAEIAAVGDEGVIGLALYMGGESTPSRAIVQSAGYAYRLQGNVLKEEFERGGTLLYPDRKTGEPVNSVRWELFREGMEDYETLRMLRAALDLLQALRERQVGHLDHVVHRDRLSWLHGARREAHRDRAGLQRRKDEPIRTEKGKEGRQTWRSLPPPPRRFGSAMTRRQVFGLTGGGVCRAY